MGVAPRKYDDRQREAVERAYGDNGIRPSSRISALAAAGDLELDGEKLEPFPIPSGTVRAIGERYLHRRLGTARAELVRQQPRDALEIVRRQLLGLLDVEIERAQRRQKAKKPISGEEIRQLTRAARELAALPGPLGEAPQAKPPGAFVDGKNTAGPTRGGLAAKIRRANEPRPIAAHNSALPPVEPSSATSAHVHEATSPRINADAESEPGSFAARRIEELGLGT